MSLARGTAVNLAARLASVALVLAITVLTARLGPATQGAFALFTSVEGLLLALGSGLAVAVARRVSHHRQAPAGLLSAGLLAAAALGALAAAVLLAVAALAGPSYRALALLAPAAPLLLLAPSVAGWWLGEGRMGPMAVVALAPPALTLGGVGAAALAAAAGKGPAVALATVLGAWVAARIAVAAGTLLAAARAGRLARPDFAALGREGRFIATIGATNLVSLLNYRVGLFAVEHAAGLAAAGVYSIAVVAAELLWFVSGSISQAAYARIGDADPARASAVTLRVLQLGGVALALLALPLLALAALLLPRLLGPAYAGSVLPLALLLPGVLLFGGASALSAYFTNHGGRPQVPAQVALASLVLNAALSAWWVPLVGPAGAAAAASVAYGASAAWLWQRFARAAGLPLAALWRPGPSLREDLRRLMPWPRRPRRPPG